MKKTRIIMGVGLVLILLVNFASAASLERTSTQIKPKEESKTRDFSNANPITTAEVNQTPGTLPKSANFIMVTDVLDGFGGQKHGNACDLSFFAGGQSSPIGTGSSTNFKLYAGFVYPTMVNCGDASGDGIVNSGDVVYLVNYLFKNGPVPKPYQAGDATCNGIVDSGDVVFLVNYLFKGGSSPSC
ncbi:MAG: dockerin type I repeat-containing protein [Candidatus Zixiibacteriota bacterium]